MIRGVNSLFSKSWLWKVDQKQILALWRQARRVIDLRICLIRKRSRLIQPELFKTSKDVKAKLRRLQFAFGGTLYKVRGENKEQLVLALQELIQAFVALLHPRMQVLL